MTEASVPGAPRGRGGGGPGSAPRPPPGQHVGTELGEHRRHRQAISQQALNRRD